ncbi:MAG: ATP-dependent DNA helicase RecG [Candidatus Gracilibacteria bacterium]
MDTSSYKYLLKTRLAEVLRTTSAHLATLRELGVVTVEDLFHYFPRAYRDRTEMTTVVELRTDLVNVVQGKLSSLFMRKTRTGKNMIRGLFSDDTGSVEVFWFNQPHIMRLLRNGDEVILTGKAKFSGTKVSLMSPLYEPVRKKQLHSARLVPMYHERPPLTSKWIREKIQPLLKGTELLDDILPLTLKDEYGLMDYGKAVRAVHDPSSEKELDAARHRLGFEELFLLQIAAMQRRFFFRQKAKNTGRQIKIDEVLSKRFLDSLSFQLTVAQERVIGEIVKDLTSPYPMMRLLQGDVGSGKTVVAAFALFHAMNSGFQSALMAPTEILARQHYRSLHQFLNGFGFNIQLLLGSFSEGEKAKIHEQIATGTVDLVVGTHALIQEGVKFAKLGLAVIDEQHRFGVKQREKLAEQGSPHVLSLSATPIPRTLAMVLYGDQDISLLDEMPKGRQVIITRLVPENKRRDAEFWIADQIKKGRQVFVVCPLIDESDVLGVKAVTTEYERLKKEVFSDLKVGLLHGKLKSDEKEKVMSEFGLGKLDILVSTSVIEVGIDVPNATIMLIEGAERFGLSQLHQFRGRVGRGEHQSYCFLFTEQDSEDSRQRLGSLVKYSNGFKLAEIDLALRGPGEVYGVKQSGIPDLKMASLSDTELVRTVREAAAQLVLKDPDLHENASLKAKLDQLKALRETAGISGDLLLIWRA